MAMVNWQNKNEAQKWVQQLIEKVPRPAVLLLGGSLGAGKTQFVKWYLEGLGITGTVSPTFAIIQEYGAAGESCTHVDLYRLESDADLESSGFWDLLTDDKALLFVEWADRLPADVWPKHWTQVFIQLSSRNGDESREVVFEIKPPQSSE